MEICLGIAFVAVQESTVHSLVRILYTQKKKRTHSNASQFVMIFLRDQSHVDNTVYIEIPYLSYRIFHEFHSLQVSNEHVFLGHSNCNARRG
jgi:hypothetical protein